MLPRLATIAIALVVVGGCISEAEGTMVWGVNESDQAVIVASLLHGSVVLPAHTWGKLFDTYNPPGGEIRVFDEDCRLLVAMPLTRSRETVRLGLAGQPEFTGSTPGMLPPGVDRAPTGPSGGDTFAQASCP